MHEQDAHVEREESRIMRRHYPRSVTVMFEEDATLDLVVTTEKVAVNLPVVSAVRFAARDAQIWLNDETLRSASVRDFIIRVSGAGDHATLAAAFREAAAVLDEHANDYQHLTADGVANEALPDSSTLSHRSERDASSA